MTTPLTLADYAAEPSPLVAGVAKKLHEESPLMGLLKFEDKAALSVKVAREGNLPNVSWRNLGADHGSVVATKPDEVTENAFSIGNMIDVDIALMKDKSARLVNPMTYQTNMIVKAMARNFTNKFVNGLPEDQKNPVGLFHRVMNELPASQRILAKSGGLDISPDATSLSSNIQAFIDKLDEAIYAVTGSLVGDGLMLLGNDTVFLRANSAFRQSGLLDQTKDALGRTFMTYRGAKIVDAGFQYDDSTKIIGDVETTNGSALSGGTATSVYVIKQGVEYLALWQEYAMQVHEPELLSNKVTLQSVIDWVLGLAISNPRSVSRLYSIVAA